jgi:hypothetical protein
MQACGKECQEKLPLMSTVDTELVKDSNMNFRLKSPNVMLSKDSITLGERKHYCSSSDLIVIFSANFFIT